MLTTRTAILLPLKGEENEDFLKLARSLRKKGFDIETSRRGHRFLKGHGEKSSVLQLRDGACPDGLPSSLVDRLHCSPSGDEGVPGGPVTFIFAELPSILTDNPKSREKRGEERSPTKRTDSLLLDLLIVTAVKEGRIVLASRAHIRLFEKAYEHPPANRAEFLEHLNRLTLDALRERGSTVLCATEELLKAKQRLRDGIKRATEKMFPNGDKERSWI